MKLVGFSSLQGLKYALTSAATFSLNLLIVWFCGNILDIFYLAAVTIGFTAETTFLYVLNRAWTFRGVTGTTVGVGYARAWLVALSTLALILGVEWLLVGILGMHYLLARVLVAPIAYAWSLFWDGTFTFGVFRVTR